MLGAQSGPFNVTTFSIRQRRTDPAAFGRAFAVSMALNYAGAPLGAAVAGPLIHLSITLTLVVAAGLAVLGALVTWRIPAESEAPKLDATRDATPHADLQL